MIDYSQPPTTQPKPLERPTDALTCLYVFKWRSCWNNYMGYIEQGRQFFLLKKDC